MTNNPKTTCSKFVTSYIHSQFYILVVLLLCTFNNPLKAQFWHYYNPTIWYDVNTVAILSPGVIAIGGGHETHDSVQVMFQSSDYGLSWYENAHDGLLPWNKSIAFYDTKNGFGVGYDGRIIKTDDAGMNWASPTVPINRDFNKIFYVGAGIFYVAGGNKTNDSMQTIVKSTNFGNTWSVIYDDYGPWLKSIFFIDTLKGFAVGDNGVLLATTDAGYNWTPAVAPVIRDFNAITFINPNVGFIVGGTASGSGKRTILRTINGGLNWSVLMDNPGGILKDISFADITTGYIVGDSATVLKTTDGGLSWQPTIIDTTLTGNESFNAVKFYAKNFGVVGGKSGLLYVYYNPPVEVFTLSSEITGITDVMVKGAINTHLKKAKYSFVYSKNFLLSPSATQEINIKNDSLLMISENISNLAPNSTYYYFIKATTAIDTVCGDTLSFYTGINPPSSFCTLDATGVGTGSAVLNGYIDNFPQHVNLYFEYGTSLKFDHQIAATPASLNDTLIHFVTGDINGITGLPSNTKCFFRLKGVTSSKIFHGDTKTYFSGNVPWVETYAATDITPASAQVNGSVTNNGLPTAIKFEYGMTFSYGSEVNAIPDSATLLSPVIASGILNGLSPGKKYHFRIKAINANGVGYGEDMQFVAGGPSVITAGVSNVSISSAGLNGSVNANNLASVNKFEYGLTTDYGHEATAIPGVTNGDSVVNISCLISGLLSDTLYHCRAKSTNAMGTNYGKDVSFKTFFPPSVTTLSASDITHVSARLNGTIDAGGKQTAVKFDYGTTTNYGSDIVATPDSASAMGSIDAKGLVTGLTPNTTYHFRIKGTNSDTTKYGNDMLFYTGNSEIPNFDFEMWTPFIHEKPLGWDLMVGRVFHYAPACHNSSAVKIMNDTTGPGQIGGLLIGYTYDIGHTFVGGTPFNARPDSIMGCFNYFIPDNDTALIFLILKKQGVIISNNMFKINGNTNGSYANLSFPISYDASGNADSLIMAITSSDLRTHTKKLFGNNFVIVDNIRFSGTSANIPNNDFEYWHLDTINTLDSWWYDNKYYEHPSHPGDYPISRTENVQNGNYAVCMQNLVYAQDNIPGAICTSNTKIGLIPGFKVNSRHKTFTGYYKFFPVNNDTMNVVIMMYKNHNVIATGALIVHATVTDYTPFSININYNDSTVPDSGLILIRACFTKPMGNSKLFVDNLNFDGFLSGIKEPAITLSNNLDFNIYPNPFNEQATVAFTINRDEKVLVRLFDLSGKQVALLADGKFTTGSHIINLSAHGLQKGFYICVINTENAVYSKKLIIY